MPFKINVNTAPSAPINRRPSDIPKGIAMMRGSKAGLMDEATGPPSIPPPPIVQMTAKAALLCWKPLHQGVSRIVLQAMPLKKQSAKVNFKKFKAGENGAKQTVLMNSCDQISSAVIAELEDETWYVFRMLISNMYGAVASEASPPRATGNLVEEEIKGSLRRKSKHRKKVSKGEANQAAEPEVFDSRVLLQKAQEAQAKEVKQQREERARTMSLAKAEKPIPASPAEDDEDATTATGESAAVEASPSAEEQEQSAAAAAAEEDETAPVETTSTSSATLEPQAPPSPMAAAPPSPVKPSAEDKSAPKSLAARLGGKISHPVIDQKTKLEEEEERRKKATKLFKAQDEHANRSKIYQALNPKPLWYESRREKEEAADDANHVDIRGNGVASLLASRDYAEERADLGEFNEILSEDEEDDGSDGEEEDGYDTDNAPDFGELAEELEEMRRKRAENEKARKAEMKAEWERKRAEEKAARDKELAIIKEKEDALKSKEEITDDDVKQAQAKLAQETATFFNFSWD